MVKRFAKYQKRPVRYQGVIYDPIPEELRYHGAAYEVVAVEQTERDRARDNAIQEALDQMAEGADLGDNAKQLLQKAIQEKKERAPKTGKELTEDETAFLEKMEQEAAQALDPSMVDLGEEDSQWKLPTPEEKAKQEAERVSLEKAEQYIQRKVTDEEVTNALRSLSNRIRKDAADFMEKAGITIKDVRFVAAEEDGIDVAADATAGNFKGDTFFVLDYAVKFPKNKKTVPLSEDEESDEPKFIDDLTAGIFNVDKATHKGPQEVIFHICRHNFVPSMNDLKSFMSAMAFLQDTGQVKAQAGALREVPEQDWKEDKKKKWFAELIKKWVHNDFEKEAGKDFSNIGKKAWGDRRKFDAVVEGGVHNKLITQAFANKLLETVDELTEKDANRFRDLVRESLQETQGEGIAATQKTVERAVQQLTKHEDYRGGVKYGIDEDGAIIAKIEAPYPFHYIFERAGPNVRLREAQMEFCDYKWVATSPGAAMKLVSADLELAHAYKRAINPSLSESRKEMEQRAVAKRITESLRSMDLIKDVESEEAVGLPKKETGTEKPAA